MSSTWFLLLLSVNCHLAISDPLSKEKTISTEDAIVIEPLKSEVTAAEGRTLLGTFPWSGTRQGTVQAQHRQHHPNEVEQDLEDEEVSEKKFNAIADLANEAGTEREEKDDGRVCIKKMMMIEYTEFDEVLTCDHTTDRR